MQRIALSTLSNYGEASSRGLTSIYISDPPKSPVLSDASFKRGNFGKTRRVNKLPVVVMIESDTDYDNSPCHLKNVD